jgi:hypothetical protein
VILRAMGYWVYCYRCHVMSSSLLFSIVHMVVPSGLCSVWCVCFVGCWVGSYRFIGCVSISGMIGVVEYVRLFDLHPSIVIALSGDVFLLVRRGSWARCLHASKASGPLSLFMIVESSCQACPHCTS